MNKEWFVLIDGIQEGPYDIKDLKKHSGFTPDTLVRKLDEAEWIAARYVQELKEVFEDELPPEIFPEKDTMAGDLSADQAALTIDCQDPFPPRFWILLVVIFLIYLIYLLSG